MLLQETLKFFLCSLGGGGLGPQAPPLAMPLLAGGRSDQSDVVFTRYDSRVGSQAKSNMFDSSDLRTDFKKCCDLEIWVIGHTRSSESTRIDTPPATSINVTYTEGQENCNAPFLYSQ